MNNDEIKKRIKKEFNKIFTVKDIKNIDYWKNKRNAKN